MVKCGCFFSGRQLSFQPASRIVQALVVRCLLFNPEGSCSNPCVCANFFTSIRKQKVLTFFGTMRLPLFGFLRLFSKIFQCPLRVLPSICLILCNRANVKKSQRILFFRGTMRLLKFLIFFRL